MGLGRQAGYRLVHQLNIDAAAVALVLIDARSETDPLGPAEFWAKAIDQARSDVPITKILVEARADRGGVAVSQEQMKDSASDLVSRDSSAPVPKLVLAFRN